MQCINHDIGTVQPSSSRPWNAVQRPPSTRREMHMQLRAHKIVVVAGKKQRWLLSGTNISQHTCQSIGENPQTP